MVKTVRYQKNKSYLAYQQSVLVFIIAFFLFGCETNKAKTNSEKKRAPTKDAKKLDSEVKIKNLTLLTDEGESSQASFSATGNEVVFVSSGRDGHTQSQVYSFDIVNKKLSRVTYSDGLVFRPLFFPNGESLIYSSSTDEDKEHPDLTKLTDKNPTSSALAEMDLLLGKSFPGFEIYIRRIRGDSIQRVQRAAGYDLAEDIDKTGKRILVSSHRGDKTDISLIDINGNLIRHFNSYKGVYLPSPRFVPQVSLTKKMLPDEIIWVRLNSDQTKDIVVTDKTDKEPKKLVAKNGQHASLAVSPDGKSFAFSSNFLDSVNYDIFIAKMDGSCLERVTMDPAEDLFPSFSPDGQKMLITSKRGGHFDVYLVDLNTESNPTCIP